MGIWFAPTDVINNDIINSVGDLNFDGQMNISDIILLVNLIIDNSEYSQSADLNFDGLINVVDIIQLINLILS